MGRWMKNDWGWDVRCIYTWRGCGREVAGPIGRRVTGRGGAVGCTTGCGTQTPGNCPTENKLHKEHGESLKSRNIVTLPKPTASHFREISVAYVDILTLFIHSFPYFSLPICLFLFLCFVLSPFRNARDISDVSFAPDGMQVIHVYLYTCTTGKQ